MASILSIHSAVAAGFVGNTVAGPVITALGHHPHLINTVMLAAHPGYGVRAGSLTAPDDLRDMLAALVQLNVMQNFGSIITGYVGAVDQINPIAAALTDWHRQTPNGVYILDPVMGDAGRLYVDAAIAEAMRQQLLPLANVVTPNQFELAYLAAMPVDGTASAIAAATALLHQHSQLTSVVATGIADDTNGRGDLLVQRDQEPVWCPARIDAHNVSGGGDLLTMLIAGYMASGQNCESAMRKACEVTQKILAASDTSRELNLLKNYALLH